MRNNACHFADTGVFRNVGKKYYSRYPAYDRNDSYTAAEPVGQLSVKIVNIRTIRQIYIVGNVWQRSNFFVPLRSGGRQPR